MDSYWPLCARRLEEEMTMTDYTKLVEALQAEVDKANKTADAYRAMYNRLPRGPVPVDTFYKGMFGESDFEDITQNVLYWMPIELPKEGV